MAIMSHLWRSFKGVQSRARLFESDVGAMLSSRNQNIADIFCLTVRRNEGGVGVYGVVAMILHSSGVGGVSSGYSPGAR